MHPSNRAADKDNRAIKTPMKYSVDSEETRAALKNVAVEEEREAVIVDNFSPVSIADPGDGKQRTDKKGLVGVLGDRGRIYAAPGLI